MINWKTSLGGIISQLPILWMQAMTLFDGDSSTNPDFTILAGSITLVWAFFQARDKDKTSEQSID